MILSGRPILAQGDETAALIVLGIQDAGGAPAAVRGLAEGSGT
jgi:hypothetical protein